jgi:long-chain acyl-CoA synthetase
METRPLSPPGVSPTVAGLLGPALATTPLAEALVGRHSRYNYEALNRAVTAAAAGLESIGVTQGARIAASSSNQPDIVIAFLATMRLGAIWVGIAPPLAPPEKAYQLRDSGAQTFLADARAAEQMAPHRSELPDLVNVVRMEPGETGGPWARLLAEHADRAPSPRAIDPFAPAAISYTSGTSGFPKGVLHSQHNIMVVAATTIGGARGDQGPPTMKRGATLSLTILNVMILTAVTVLAGGGSLVCVDRRDARGIAEWIRDERIGHVHLSGAHIHDMLTNHTTRSELESLRFANNAGADIPVSLRQRFEETLGPRALTSYGLTEVPAGATGFPCDAALVEGSCGIPYRHLDVAILDKDNNRVCQGEVGEICIRAAQTGPWANMYRPMLGYWNNPEATAKALRGGWLHTADLGCFDEHGHLRIRDRMSEVVLRGGANVYPAEIERVLRADPIVRDVAVVGRPDERLGEEVVAVVEIVAGQDRDAALGMLEARCARELAKYKWPSEWRFVDTLPRNAMNKVIKPQVKAMVARNKA